MKKYFLFIILIIIQVLSFCQEIKITQGKENAIEASEAIFNIVSQTDEKLIVIEKSYDRGSSGYYIHSYDAKKDYELIKRTKIDLNGKQLNGELKIKDIRVVDSFVYIIVVNKNKRETKKKYFGAIYNLDLSLKKDWVEFLSFELPSGHNFIDWENISYDKIDSVFYIYDASNPKADDNFYSRVFLFFDLNFEQVEFEDKEDYGLYTAKGDDEFPHYFKRDLKTLDDRTVELSVYSNKPVNESQKNAKQSVNFSIENKAANIKYGYGRVAVFPKGYSAQLIDGYYNETDDNLYIFVLYKDSKARKNEYSGIYVANYDVNGDELISEEYHSFSDEIKRNFSKSKVLKKYSRGHEFGSSYYFSIFPTDDGKYRVVAEFASRSTMSNEKGESKKIIFGDVIYFETDETSKVQNEYVINKYFENDDAAYFTSFGSQKIDDCLTFHAKDKFVLAFLDSRKNYSEGGYNGKNKNNNGGANKVLAIFKIAEKEKFERSILINSFIDEFGVIPQSDCVFKDGKNKYRWFSFYNGKTKVLTLSLN